MGLRLNEEAEGAHTGTATPGRRWDMGADVALLQAPGCLGGWTSEDTTAPVTGGSAVVFAAALSPCLRPLLPPAFLCTSIPSPRRRGRREVPSGPSKGGGQSVCSDLGETPSPGQSGWQRRRRPPWAEHEAQACTTPQKAAAVLRASGTLSSHWGSATGSLCFGLLQGLHQGQAPLG